MTKELMVVLKDLGDIAKSTAPLLVMLLVVKLLLKPQFQNPKGFVVGLVFVLVGLFIFLKGVSMCLLPLAEDVGAALHNVPYRWLVFVICFGIGFTATLVEPALKTLATQVDEVSVGVLRPNTLIYSTAVGVAAGMTLGIMKVLYNIKTGYIVFPCLLVLLALCFILTLRDKGDFILSVAFDCAAATTGPVNIPINAAISLGLAAVIGADPMRVGFGLVGLTSLGAATSVMAAGILSR